MRMLTSKLSALLFAVLIGFHADAARIEVSQALAFPGEEVTITVMIDDLPERTTAIQGTLVWDENLITLMDANTGILPDMTFNTQNDDRLGFSWFNGNGEEIVGENELINLTFMVTEEIEAETQRAMIRFGNDPTATEVGGTGSTVSLETVEGYIDITGGLPVELRAFDATPTNDAIALTWATDSESNFEGFEVQRSIDGNNFSIIAWLDARGNEAQGASYGYADSDATSGKTYYYRLQMWDFDASSEYSNVISARIEGRGPVIEVFPNPTHHEAVLAFENFTEIDAPVLVTIHDNMGRTVQQLNYPVQAGKNIIHLNVNNLSAGMYTIRLEQGEYFATRKLIVR